MISIDPLCVQTHTPRNIGYDIAREGGNPAALHGASYHAADLSREWTVMYARAESML